MTVYVTRKTERVGSTRVHVWYTSDAEERTDIERWSVPWPEVWPFIDRIIANIKATFGPVEIISY